MTSDYQRLQEAAIKAAVTDLLVEFTRITGAPVHGLDLMFSGPTIGYPGQELIQVTIRTED